MNPPNDILSIVLVKGTDFGSRQIEHFTRSLYSHSLIWRPDGGLWESVTGGVHQLGDFSAAYTAHYDVFQMPLTPIQTNNILNFCQSKNGLPYAWKGDMAFATGLFNGNPLVNPNPGAWFCSELVFAAYQNAGINLLNNVSPWLVNPGDLAWSTLLNLVLSVP